MYFSKYERFLFYLLLIAFLAPLAQGRYFPTVDGPAHLYNAKLIVELLKDPDGYLAAHHDLDLLLQPNISGHVLLSLLLLVVPAFVAEKLLLGLLIIGLPLGTRFALRAAGTQAPEITYLIFPFTYSYLFYFGFYNFNIAVVLYLFTIGSWLNYLRDPRPLKLLGLSLLSLLICLSHLFVFAILLLTVMILWLEHLSRHSPKSKEQLLNLLHQALALLPGITILLLFFLSGKSAPADLQWLSFKDILISLKYIMPIKGIEYDGYDLISRSLLYIFTFSTAFLVVRTFIRVIRKHPPHLNLNTFAITAACILILLFTVPDGTGNAGFISARLMHFFFILFVLWHGSHTWPNWYRIVLVIGSLGINVLLLFHNLNANNSKALAEHIREVSFLIDEESTVLPINCSSDPLQAHIGNYAGADKRLVILENYEASLAYFPISWDQQHMKKFILGEMEPSECISWPSNSKGTLQQIEFVLLIDEDESCSSLACHAQLHEKLDTYYELVDTGSNRPVELYRLRDRKK